MRLLAFDRVHPERSVDASCRVEHNVVNANEHEFVFIEAELKEIS